MPGPTALVLAAGAIALGALLQGAAGFGMSLLSVPLLALISTSLVPGPTMVPSLVVNVLVSRREHAHIDVGGVRAAAIGIVPGTVLAALVVSVVAEGTLARLIAIIILVAVALAAGPWRPRRTPGLLFGAGVVSGFMGTAAGPAGPPIALAYADARGPVLRATLNAFFGVASVLSIAGLIVAGRFGRHELVWGLWLVPGAVLGYAVSGRLHALVDRSHTRPIVLTVAGLSGLALLLRHL